MDSVSAADGSDALSILPVLIAARWVHFAALFILFGSAFFWLCVNGGAGARRATDSLLRGAALIAALSGLCWLAAIVANMAGGFDQVFDGAILETFLFQTDFGPVVALRLVLLAACVVAALAPVTARARLWVLGAIGAALLVDQAWLGHAAEGMGLEGAEMRAAYSVHVLAAAAWLGGLPPLLFAVFDLRTRPAPEARDAALTVLSSYSLMAVLAVAAIVLTGFANFGFHRGASSGPLFSTDYGRVLAVKLVLVAIMLAFAAFNRLVAMPGLRTGDQAMPARLRLSIAAELAVGVLVLGVAAVLGVTPPPP